MSMSEYEKLVPLITYFFENTGATSVEIGDPPIKVTKKEYNQSLNFSSSETRLDRLLMGIWLAPFITP